ncbi:MAG: AAA family ATPase, partial [Candidatus Margulisiibacteriota bacterium]
MLARKATQSILQFAKQYPIITLTGPRQSGKTTLTKICFPEKPYLSLEDPDTRKIAIEDPRSIL